MGKRNSVGWLGVFRATVKYIAIVLESSLRMLIITINKVTTDLDFLAVASVAQIRKLELTKLESLCGLEASLSVVLIAVGRDHSNLVLLHEICSKKFLTGTRESHTFKRVDFAEIDEIPSKFETRHAHDFNILNTVIHHLLSKIKNATTPDLFFCMPL